MPSPLLIPRLLVTIALLASLPEIHAQPGPPPPGGAPRQPRPDPDWVPDEAKSIPPPKTDAELAAAVIRLADDLSEHGRFSGTIRLERNDLSQPLLNKAWGEADRTTHAPNTIDTSFNYGSIGKLFTQIAILQLAEAGRVELDATVGSVLPDYPNAAVARSVTIRQLLTHRSGLGDFFGPRHLAKSANQLATLQDYLPLFADAAPAFAPGTGNQYSNAGYIVLGLVIERLSGVSYREYVLEHIARPAGFTRAGWFARDALPDYAARGYLPQPDGSWSTDHFGPGEAGTSAGGGYASATDLANLARALREGRLLGPTGQRELAGRFESRPSTAPGEANALAGLDVGGGAPGVNAALVVSPDGRYTLVVLANQSPPAAAAIANTVRRWLARKT